MGAPTSRTARCARRRWRCSPGFRHGSGSQAGGPSSIQKRGPSPEQVTKPTGSWPSRTSLRAPILPNSTPPLWTSRPRQRSSTEPLSRWRPDRSGAASVGRITENWPPSSRRTRPWSWWVALTTLVWGRRSLGRSGGRAVNACGRLTLRQSAALLKRAVLLVTNDSAPLHLASAVGTPIVALFGPTVTEFGFGPVRPGDVALGMELQCRPCSSHGPPQCPLGHHRCMRDLTVEAVTRAIEELGALRRRN